MSIHGEPHSHPSPPSSSHTHPFTPRKKPGDPDFVLDCIDDAPTKAELLGYCVTKGLRVIASLGAALKVGVCVCMLGVWWCQPNSTPPKNAPTHTYIHVCIYNV